ncbi:RadC family protein [Effusibacillus pohliae]|uniref:RadC family protein n=1 Tax=Effusibacillus pohliae TaxID=232270 RepID=UPI000372C03E|nr:DNA repair protein RadC [Effusibacillus pohliae]
MSELKSESVTRVPVRDLPTEDRPRERLLRDGAISLSNAELLAILLRTGSNGQSVIGLAEQLLSRFGGLRPLMEADIRELVDIQGMGPAKAIQIQAAIELGKRIARLTREPVTVIRNPQDVADLLMDRLRFEKKEHFIVIHMDIKNQVMAQEIASIGSLDTSIVHPREIFKSALKKSSASIICVHNHPSGDPTPSREDILVTRRLAEVGQILGIELLDHVVIGEHRFVSMKEEGLF